MEFAACRDDDALFCNAEGSTYETTECPLGCSEALASCNQCVPGTLSCDGDSLSTCGADGTPSSSEACQLGCVDGADPHCARVVPRYLPDVCDVAAANGALIISSSATFDTSLNASCSGGVIVQTGGPEICVLRYGTITLDAGVSLVVTGPRAIALVADRTVSIAGLLDVSANAGQNGPGGGTLRSGGAAPNSSGFGGAGFKTLGGSGGSSALDGGAGNGGQSVDPSTLAALVGGPQILPELDPNYAMGPGGGAATLVSCLGIFEVSGEIHAGGGPGLGGGFIGIANLGGSGGGAGGNVVLQGANVVITGKLFANGGSGGAGKPAGGGNGAAGYEGERSLVAITGGIGTAGGGSGGAGGTGTTLPGHGKQVTMAPMATGGGGGGSVGFFQSYTPAGVTPTLTPSAASPMPQPNGTIPTR